MAVRRSKKASSEAAGTALVPQPPASAAWPLPPWLSEPLEGLCLRTVMGRLPPGLLVVGPSGIGKGLLARRFLQTLACTHIQLGASAGANAGLAPCGVCNGCRSFLFGNHPEFLVVAPEEPSKEITVDRIREVIDFLSISHTGWARIVLLDPADALNANAANALLKTLEEPPANAALMLLASQPARLLPTVRSRCEVLRIGRPEPEAMLAWLSSLPVTSAVAADWSIAQALAASLYRPLLAMDLLQDPLAREAWKKDFDALTMILSGASVFVLAKQLMNCDLVSFLPRLQMLLISAQRYLHTATVDDFGQLFTHERVTRFAQRTGARELAELFQQSIRWQRQMGVALNPQLRSEDIALTIQRAGRSL